jgi:hypothetical protein
MSEVRAAIDAGVARAQRVVPHRSRVAAPIGRGIGTDRILEAVRAPLVLELHDGRPGRILARVVDLQRDDEAAGGQRACEKVRRLPVEMRAQEEKADSAEEQDRGGEAGGPPLLAMRRLQRVEVRPGNPCLVFLAEDFRAENPLLPRTRFL